MFDKTLAALQQLETDIADVGTPIEAWMVGAASEIAVVPQIFAGLQKALADLRAAVSVMVTEAEDAFIAQPTAVVTPAAVAAALGAPTSAPNPAQ